MGTTESYFSPSCLLQVDLTILVLDVNDNAPVFQKRDYTVTLPEDVAVGTEVMRVLATSADIGPNAEVTYRIRSGNELGRFAIDRNRGEVLGCGLMLLDSSVELKLTFNKFNYIQ